MLAKYNPLSGVTIHFETSQEEITVAMATLEILCDAFPEHYDQLSALYKCIKQNQIYSFKENQNGDTTCWVLYKVRTMQQSPRLLQ